MDLKTFVSTTLQEIVAGISEAKAAIEQIDSSARINPTMRSHNSQRSAITNEKPVEFDVAVTVSEEAGGGGKAGVKIASLFEVGGEAKSRSASETVSRIKFSVGLAQPGSVETSAPPQPIPYSTTRLA